MCHRYKGSFYEPPEFEYCDEVANAASEYAVEAGRQSDEPTTEMLEDAVDAIHGGPESERDWDYDRGDK